MIKQISLKIQRLRLERERCNGQIVDYRGKERERREGKKKRNRKGVKKEERVREEGKQKREREEG